MYACATAWRPLTLCWKRLLPHAGAAASAVLRPLRQEFHTQLHLHFVVAPDAGSRPASPATPAAARFPRVTLANRTFAHHQHVRVHRHVPQCANDRVRNERVTVFERLPSRLVGAAATLPVPRRALTTATREAAAAPRRVLMPSMHPVLARRPRARLVSVAPYPCAVASQIESESRPAMRRLAIAPPATLVWCNPKAPGLATEGIPWRTGADIAPGVDGVAAVARIASPTPISAKTVQPSDIARETRRALLLDATFTDRLADDVLRKVDKRVRIERERRGL